MELGLLTFIWMLYLLVFMALKGFLWKNVCSSNICGSPLVRGLQRDTAVERAKAVGTVSIPAPLLSVSPLGAYK